MLLYIVILHSFVCNFKNMCNVNLEGKKFYHVLKDFYL